MKIKKVICDISRTGDNIKIDTTCLLVSRGFFDTKKTKRTYEIVNQFSVSEPFNSETKMDEIGNIGMIIKSKLKEYGFERSKITLLVDLECIFNGKINLPKIKGRNLSNFFYQELHNHYGENIEDRFHINVDTSENMSGGYTFNITFIEKNIYRKILRIFSTQTMDVETVHYLPDLYVKFFKFYVGYHRTSNVGVIITEHETRIFLQKQNKILNLQKLPLDFTIENKNEDIGMMTLLVLNQQDYANIDVITTKVFALLAAYPEVTEIEKIFIHNGIGNHELLRLAFIKSFGDQMTMSEGEEKAVINHFLEYVINSDGDIPKLPLKVS